MVSIRIVRLDGPPLIHLLCIFEGARPPVVFGGDLAATAAIASALQTFELHLNDFMKLGMDIFEQICRGPSMNLG